MQAERFERPRGGKKDEDSFNPVARGHRGSGFILLPGTDNRLVLRNRPGQSHPSTAIFNPDQHAIVSSRGIREKS